MSSIPEGAADWHEDANGVTAQLTLEQPLAHPFSGLGLERCQHTSQRGIQCTTLGTWGGLSGRVLCDLHANEAA